MHSSTLQNMEWKTNLTSREIVKNLKRFKKPGGFNADELAKLIEKAYLGQRRDSQHTTKKTFSPSTIAYGHGTCARYWYLAFSGSQFEETTDALGVANMSNGTFAHTRLQKLFEESGILLGEEIEVLLDDPPIRGFADVLVEMDGEKAIGEIKTTRQEAFEFRRVTMKPSANHLIQILIYMHQQQLEKGFLFYENKNTQEFLVIPVDMNERNKKILEDVFEWLRIVRKSFDDGVLPEKPVKRKDAKICQGCPIRKVCWEETPVGDVLIPVMSVPKV